jgi:hypothetical protein
MSGSDSSRHSTFCSVRTLLTMPLSRVVFCTTSCFVTTDIWRKKYPGGLEEALAKQHGGIRWNGTEGMWVRDGSDQNEAATYDNQPPLVPTPFPLVHTAAETRRLGVQWERVMNALVDHHEYCFTRSGS